MFDLDRLLIKTEAHPDILASPRPTPGALYKRHATESHVRMPLHHRRACKLAVQYLSPQAQRLTKDHSKVPKIGGKEATQASEWHGTVTLYNQSGHAQITVEWRLSVVARRQC